MDANFFISLAQTREPRALERALELAKAQEWTMHVTEPILEEVRYVRCKGSKARAAQMAASMMQVHPADEKSIASLRTELGGATRAPQSPDLSLMVLARDLAKEGGKVRLVSDDFKISLSSRELGMPYAVVSPSVFLFSLSRELRGDDRSSVRSLYKHVRHGEMEYLLSRADMYNVEDKLTWLMDNLIQTVTVPEVGPAPAPVAHGPERRGERHREEGDWRALIRHLRGERVRRGHLKPFDGILPHLEPLEDIIGILQEVHQIADSGDLEGALRRAHRELSSLKSHLQLSVGALELHDGRLVMRAYAELMPHLEMLTALLHINLGDVVDCEDHLDNVALLALAAGLVPIVVETNYLEALVHAYREAWEDAKQQFDLTLRLARQSGDEATVLGSLLGVAVSQLLSGDRDGAETTMHEVNALVEADPATGSIVLEEFGDHFTNFGAVPLATGFYSEALECAVEVRVTEGAERLLGKLRRARASMGLEDRDTAGEILDLMDMANDIQDAELLARYQELQAELDRQVSRLREPLEERLSEWSDSSRLPDPLEEWLDIIRANPLPKGEGTMLVCYSAELGNVGVLITDPVIIPGIEHARFRVKPGSRVKLVEAPEPWRSGYRLRAIVVLNQGDPYELDRRPIRLRRSAPAPGPGG